MRLIPSLSRCLSTLFFLNSLYLFSLLCLVPFFFFFGPVYLVFVGWTSCIAYPLFLNTADAIGCNQSRIESYRDCMRCCLSRDETQSGLEITLFTYRVGREAVAACQSVASTGRAQFVVTTPAESCGRQLIPGA